MPIVLYDPISYAGQGEESGPVAGSNKSPIRGVDALWEYNNLVMNDRRKYETYIINDIDGLDDADVRDTRENKTGSHGEISYNSFYGGRTIVLSGKIKAFSYEKLKDLEYAMHDAFNALTESPLTIRNVDSTRDIVVMAKKNQKLVIKETQNNFNFERDFQVSLRASTEYFSSKLSNYAVIENAKISDPTGTVIANSGNWESGFRIIVTGSLPAGFFVKNQNTNEQIKIDYAVGAGEQVIIDSVNDTVTNSSGANLFQFVDPQTDLFKLVKGNNIIEVSSIGVKGSGAKAELYWTNNYK